MKNKPYLEFLKGFIMTVMLWWILSLFVDKIFLPGPLESGIYLVNNFFSSAFYVDLLYSLSRILAALSMVLAIGYPLGIFMGISKRAESWLGPFVYFFNPLPKIVFLPVFFVFLGIGESTRIFLLFFIILFPVIIQVRDGIKSIPPDYEELFFTLGAPRKDYLRFYVPFSMPALFTSLRTASGMAVAVLFIIENYVGDRGLGVLILRSMEIRNYPQMYSGIILMGILGYVLYLLTNYAERKVCFWK